LTRAGTLVIASDLGAESAQTPIEIRAKCIAFVDTCHYSVVVCPHTSSENNSSEQLFVERSGQRLAPFFSSGVRGSNLSSRKRRFVHVVPQPLAPKDHSKNEECSKQARGANAPIVIAFISGHR
jgi:hypothetical protein